MIRKHDMTMALRRAYLSMHRQTNALLAPYNITADQFVCLVILDEQDGITQQELVKRATSDPNTIRAMLLLLEKRGLIAREDHPTDGRARIVHLTSEGKRLFKECADGVKPVQDRLIAPFSNREANILILNLKRILETMQE